MFGALLLGSGCGTEQPIANSVPSSADLSAMLNCRGTSLDLADGAGTFRLDSSLPALRHVPADDLKGLEAGQEKSLCDLMRESNKQMALISFVSSKCYDCMKWLDQMESDLTSGKLDSSVLLVAVMVDPPEEVSDGDMADLQGDVAPDAVWVRDVNEGMWNFFSTATTTNPPVTPMTIAMDWAARGFFCDTKFTPAKTLVQLSDQLMNLTIAAN
jgi:hypothetical protein